MKLLFDENLSHKLPNMLGGLFAGSSHVRECGLKGATDEKIWDYSKTDDWILVSKDSDFYQRAILRGSPPKVVWLRIGNCSTKMISDLLNDHHSDIGAFANSTEDILTLTCDQGGDTNRLPVESQK